MTLSPIEAHLQRAERRAVETLSLRSVTLPERFAQARGMWKDAPVTIMTHAFEGDALSHLRVAYVTGVQLSLGTLFAMPRANRALPVLSVDLARLGAERDTLIAVDLAPMSASAPPGNAVNMRVSPARLTEALITVDRSVDAWIALAAGAEPVPETAGDARARQHAWTAARRSDEQWLTLLGTMFGRAWWGEYVEKVLFPSI